MKIQFNIDKQASLLAGLEAQDDKITIDLPVADMSEDLRKKVIPHYNNFCFCAPGVVSPKVLSNCGTAGALLAVQQFADTLDRLAAERQERERQEQERRQGAIEALLSGAETITTLYHGSLQTSSGRGLVRPCPEIDHLIEAFKAAEEARGRERLARQLAEDEARKARQINGKDLYEWPVTDGTVDQTVIDAVPYDKNSQARNWMATVSFNVRSPGQLDRQFWSGSAKARGVPILVPGDYIEGASKDKKGRPNYKYFRVLEVGHDKIVVRGAGTLTSNPPPIEPELEKYASIHATTSQQEALAE